MTTTTLVSASAATADRITKIYGVGAAGIRALDDVTLEIAARRLTAIMGPSGSGKSTLMHCLAGLDTVTSGSVSIGDVELRGLSDKKMTALRRDPVASWGVRPTRRPCGGCPRSGRPGR